MQNSGHMHSLSAVAGCVNSVNYKHLRFAGHWVLMIISRLKLAKHQFMV